MDVGAKQRLSSLACPLNLKMRDGGFAPRHLKRLIVSRFLLPLEQKANLFCP